MDFRQFSYEIQGKIHHHAKFTMQDGSVHEGYMQPNDGEYAYLTTLDGATGGSVKISDIKSVEWPDE